MKLALRAFLKFTIGLLLVAAIVFIPAGSLSYINGWLFIGLLFVPMLALGIVLFIKFPDLLEKRLNAKEKQKAQKGVVALSGILFVAGFFVASQDFKYSLSSVPDWAVIVASVVFLASYALYAEVMRENAYLSRTVEVFEGQKVIDTGLYGIVRHPMYAATIGMFLSIPIILGSLWALCCFAPYIAVIVVRIINEEKLLEKELSGYTEYKKKVKFRLLPFIW